MDIILVLLTMRSAFANFVDRVKKCSCFRRAPNRALAPVATCPMLVASETGRELQPVANAPLATGEFHAQLGLLDAAAVGVVLCRSREPHRAIEAIKAYAFSQKREFANWSPLYGWEQYDRNEPLKAPKTDQLKEPVSALQKLGGLDGTEGFPSGFYTFFYPHFWLKDTVAQRVPLIYTLKEYVRSFVEGKRRLILVTPLGFSLPPEVAEDIVVLDFDAPSYAELKIALENVFENLPKKPALTNSEKDRLVAAGMGMSHQEFETAVARAIVAYRHTLPNVDIEDLVAEVMKVKTEVVKRSEVLEVMPPAKMGDVGGLDNLKEWVRKRSKCFSQEAKDFGIEAPKGTLLAGPPGTGTGCQPAGSKILMADGLWKQIEDLLIGDIVLSPQDDGEVLPVRVSSVFARDCEPIYRIRTTGRSGEKSYLCSGSHVMTIRALNRPGSSSQTRRRVSETVDMRVDEFLNRGDVWRSKARLFTTPAYDLPPQALPVDPYTLGVILGDGSLTDLDYYGHYDVQLGYNTGSTASVTSSYLVLERVSRINRLPSPKPLPDRNAHILNIQEGTLKEGLRSLRLVRVDSYSKFIPEVYMRGSLQQRLDLLAGLVDTDGTSEEFSSSNRGLAEAFAQLVYSVGGTAKVTQRTSNYQGAPYESFRVTYSTAEHQIPTVQDYKRRRQRDMGWKNPRNTSFEIERVGDAPVFGFTLDTGTQRYITDDFLVTSCRCLG